MTAGTMIVLGIVILVIAGAVISLVRGHHSGRCSCGCDGCCGCKSCVKCVEIKERKT